MRKRTSFSWNLCVSITGFSTEASYISCMLTLHLSFPNTMYTASQSAPNFKAFFFFKFFKLLVSYPDFSNFYAGYASELQVCN